MLCRGCTHIHTFRSHWRNKTKGRNRGRRLSDAGLGSMCHLTQTAAHKITFCLLFMEGLSATLHALFIWRLLKTTAKSHSGKDTHTVSTVWEHMHCMFVCWKDVTRKLSCISEVSFRQVRRFWRTSWQLKYTVHVQCTWSVFVFLGFKMPGP